MKTMTEHEIAAKFTHAGVLMLLAVLFVASLLSGCSKRISDRGNGLEPALYTDVATGCQYLAADLTYSTLIPRVAADGKSHMGCKVAP